jgi:hypothetical protein
MKNLLIVSAFVLSFGASAGDLLTLSTGSGFGPHVFSSKVSISETGSITRSVQSAGETKKETLGKLSTSAVQGLKDKIETIADNAKLVDPNPKAPKCMDAPSSSVSVNKGGKVITIALRANCHNSAVEDLYSSNLVDLIQGLSSL